MKNKITLDDERIVYLKGKDKRLAVVFGLIGDICYETHEDGYKFIVGEIVEQMLSVKAADKIRGRLAGLCNGAITPKSIAGLTVDDLRGIGISRGKSLYILNFTEAVRSKAIALDEIKNMDDADAMAKLMGLKGIGSWTAKMYLLFVLERENILPYEDGAFLQAYRWLYSTRKTKPEDIIKRCRKWEPYSSIASRYLYRALDGGLTKIPFKTYLEGNDAVLA
jgi:DNA-3-methyladenine glycosylase II